MKKTAFWCLLLICCSCIAFTGGFFIGRNHNRTPVLVERIPIVTQSTAAEKLNINTATLDQLQTLPGIGQELAQRIIDYRQKHGPFQKVADLAKVEGIGVNKLDTILDLITTGG